MEKIEKINLKSKFVCVRCGYNSSQIIDMKRHLEKQKKCEWKDGKDLNMSEVEIYNLSIQKKCENTENIIKVYEENKEKIKKEDINWKEYNLTCEYCYKKLSSVGNLDRHIKTCKTKKLINKIDNEKNKKENENNNNSNIKNISNNQSIVNNNQITNNIVNNIQNQNITNNITINIDKNCVEKILIPFYEKFDTSHINEETKLDLLLSTLYEDTLKEILKNEINLNFYLENSEDNKSIIFHENKINRINNEEIYQIIWEKIKNYLIETLQHIKSIKTKYDKEMLNFLENKILTKHNYLNDKNKNIYIEVRNIMNRCSEENKQRIFSGFEKIENKNQMIKELLENNNI
jgi:hypothetical protein